MAIFQQGSDLLAWLVNGLGEYLTIFQQGSDLLAWPVNGLGEYFYGGTERGVWDGLECVRMWTGPPSNLRFEGEAGLQFTNHMMP